MFKVMIFGAGNIGSLIACLFVESGDYEVHWADVNFSGHDAKRLLAKSPQIKTVTLDVTKQQETLDYLIKNHIVAIISSLPYFLNSGLAAVAKEAKAHYFDMTEDTSVTDTIKSIAQCSKTAFVPQCGLAPGFISIVATSIMSEFEECRSAQLRVGALPQRVSHAPHYSLTWSTDGLINEYGNACYALEEGKLVQLKPLEGLESIEFDGCEYEAFNTSGGLGGLAELFVGKINSLNYKTIRYPGHCEKMRFLMNDLQLNSDRKTLKTIFERVIPKTYQDLVVVYVSVEGLKHGVLSEKSYFKKIYPAEIHGLEWSAIQISTASGLCAVVDLVLTDSCPFHGFVLQERFSLAEILGNRFGKYYKSE